jgi:hypothetical protein
MNSKTGVISGAVGKLQFTDKPRIIFGLDVLHAANIGK